MLPIYKELYEEMANENVLFTEARKPVILDLVCQLHADRFVKNLEKRNLLL